MKYYFEELLSELPFAKEGEDYLESLVVDPDSLSIILKSSSGEVKTVCFDTQEQLQQIGTKIRLELYNRDYDTRTTKPAVFNK